MDGVRIIIIILGLIVILGLLGHGLWSIRKNQRGAARNSKGGKKRAGSNLSAEEQRKLDESGFDQDGIGQVRTVKSEPTQAKSATASARKQPERRANVQARRPVERKATERKTPEQTEKKEPSIAQQGLFDDLDSPETQVKRDTRKEPSIGAEQISLGFDAPELKAPNVDEENLTPKESSIAETDINLGSEDKSSDGSIASEQVENSSEYSSVDIGDGESIDEEAQEPEDDGIEVITLFVSGDIQGAILLQTLTELGLKYGEMDIFHRHEDTAGKGPKLFSIANMYNPGVFDLDGIENFSTRGVALFMTLPLEADGHSAFTMMYNAANKIAEAMPRAAVLDGNRNPITKQSVQHTYQKIREFERKQKLAGASR